MGEELERLQFDVTDAVRALENGRPLPAHVGRDIKAQALRMLRRELDLPPTENKERSQ